MATDKYKNSSDMENEIKELMDRFDEGNMSINDLERELLVLYRVSKRSAPWFMIGFIVGLLTMTIVIMGAI